MNKTSNFSPEVRERAVRLVSEYRADHPSHWTAVVSIANKIDCKPQALLGWLRQHEKGTGQRDGTTTAELDRRWAADVVLAELVIGFAVVGGNLLQAFNLEALV
jgi:transposase